MGCVGVLDGSILAVAGNLWDYCSQSMVLQNTRHPCSRVPAEQHGLGFRVTRACKIGASPRLDKTCTIRAPLYTTPPPSSRLMNLNFA